MMPAVLRRRSLVFGGAAAALGVSLAPAHAQAGAIRRPRFLYGFPAGSAGDVLARRVAERVAGTTYARHAALVENKPGAGGRLALDALKAAPADGSVLCLSPFSAVSIYPHVYRRLNYDPVADFAPVGIAAYIHHGLAVGPLVPDSVRDLRGFVAWARQHPEHANYGSPGAGSTPHFLGALLGLREGLDLRHVPYRGSVPGVTDLVSGQIAAMFTPVGDFLAFHRAGRLRVLATSGRARMPFAAGVATFAEQGFEALTVEEWFGFHAPRKTPADVLAAANAAINAALTTDDLIEGAAAVGLVVRGSSAEEMASSQRAEFERWKPLVQRIGFTVDS